MDHEGSRAGGHDLRETDSPVSFGLQWGQDAPEPDLQSWESDSLIPRGAKDASPTTESRPEPQGVDSAPADSFSEPRKRPRGELRDRAELALGDASEPSTREQRRLTRPRAAAHQSRSPKEASSDSGDDFRGRRHSGRAYYRSYAEQLEKPDAASAAKVKASRERLRRERLNDSFVELTRTLDPEKYIRAEKTTIIAETIKMLQSMRLENEQLRHDKNALGERVREAEKEKETLVFEQRLLKRELETMQAASFSQQSVHAMQHGAGFQGPSVAVGLPVPGMHPPRPMGGIAQMLEAGPAMSHMLHPPALGPADIPHSLPPATRGQPPMSDAFVGLLPSPPELLDLHELNRELSLFAGGQAPGGSSAGDWLPPATETF